jgi:hypothetical protein
MKYFLTLLLCGVLSFPMGYYQLYVWKCVNCDCKYYGNNPPKRSKCLKKGLYDIWELDRIESVPLTNEQLRKMG